jgi:hydrogenase maturation protein HypF
MPGGDLSALRYGRMLQGVLYGEVPDDELRELITRDYIQGFLQGEKEVDIVFDQLKKGVFTPKTTSAGRLLDAVSCLLGVSYLRTYEGEGAMKLEAFAFNGRRSTFSLPVDVDEEGGISVLNTSRMVVGLLEAMGSVKREDLAYEFQRALADGLAEMALRAAEAQGISKIGFSGGVANNGMITRILRERVEGQGLVLLRHRSVPCGDGGVSLGQAAIASFKIE